VGLHHFDGHPLSEAATEGCSQRTSMNLETNDLVGHSLRSSGLRSSSCVVEVVDRVRRAGASGEQTLRSDYGFFSKYGVQACFDHDVRYSITVRQTPGIKNYRGYRREVWAPIDYTTGATPGSARPTTRASAASCAAPVCTTPGPRSSPTTAITPSSPTARTTPLPSTPTNWS
jgi:hypothetical protein